MAQLSPQLLQILKIAKDVSSKGEGISLKEALDRTQYTAIRKDFSTDDLIPLIDTNLDLLMDWIMYSEDKRTEEGWYLLENGEIGQIGNPESREYMTTQSRAVAEYVIRELDYWAGQ